MASRAGAFLATHAPFAAVEARTRALIASRCRSLSRRSGEALFASGVPASLSPQSSPGNRRAAAHWPRRWGRCCSCALPWGGI